MAVNLLVTTFVANLRVMAKFQTDRTTIDEKIMNVTSKPNRRETKNVDLAANSRYSEYVIVVKIVQFRF